MVEGGTDRTKKKARGFVFEFWEIRCGGTSAASPRRGVARGGFLNAWNVFESPSVARDYFTVLTEEIFSSSTRKTHSRLVSDAAGKTTILYKLKLGKS